MGVKKLEKIVKKNKVDLFVPKQNNTIPMFELLQSIDDFFDKLKKNKSIEDKTKVQVMDNFNKVLININETFNKMSSKLDVEYNEPMSIKLLLNKYKR